MKKFLFLLVDLILMFNVSAKDNTPEFQDTIGIRDYIISECTHAWNPNILEAKEYGVTVLNKYIDRELPILHKKLNLYDELFNEYQSLTDNNKLSFLKRNKLKIMDIGFKELTSIEEGNKIFNQNNHDNVHKAFQYRTIADIVGYGLEQMRSDLENYISYYTNSVFHNKWSDFINGLRKFGFTEERATKLANDSNFYEDSDGYVKYYEPQQTTPKNKTKRNNHKRK